MSSYTYSIEYARKLHDSSLQHWNNGFLITQPSTGWIWLKQSNQTTLNKGAIDKKFFDSVEEGATVNCGPFVIKIIQLKRKFDAHPSNQSENDSTKCTSEKSPDKPPASVRPADTLTSLPKQIFHEKSCLPTSSLSAPSGHQNVLGQLSTNTSASEREDRASTFVKNLQVRQSLVAARSQAMVSKPNPPPAPPKFAHLMQNKEQNDADVSLDPSLRALMRPHQIAGANFLLARLMGKNADMEKLTNDPTAIHAHRHTTSHSDHPNIDMNLVTGAILADEMGTGKTLTSLSVLWSLCRHGLRKGIIVCPSSLIRNWEAEVNKWLGVSLGRRFLYVTSNGSSGNKGSDAIVHKFVTTHASVHPVLVISYDMFRCFAEAFNTVESLEVLICDEGHRLKNAYGTKTTLALSNCIATKRVLVTGTPVQNNLDELYAVVQFSVPNYLGTLADFKAKYADDIVAGQLEGASTTAIAKATQAADALKCRLSAILIRRTRNEVLKAVLPPRKEFVLVCALTKLQQEEYVREARQMLDSLNILCPQNRAKKICTNSSSNASRNISNSDVTDVEHFMGEGGVEETDGADGVCRIDSRLSGRNINAHSGAECEGDGISVHEGGEHGINDDGLGAGASRQGLTRESTRKRKIIVVQDDESDEADEDNEDEENDEDDEDVEEERYKAKIKGKGKGKGKGRDKVKETDKEKERSKISQNIHTAKMMTGILPNLMRLRLICDIASSPITPYGDQNDGISISSNGTFNAPSTSSLSSSDIKSTTLTLTNNDSKTRMSQLYHSLLKRSAKLRVLDCLLTALYQEGNEKVVVVSNFTSTLDDVHDLAQTRKWPSLRLDGSVPAEKRMNLVKHFNTPTDPFFIMLLSAKAGGVGLNLTGGSRLILMEPDWNPATDAQAMGRVWREGQTKPVFIYRMLSHGTVEETIFQRQHAKGGLAVLVGGDLDAGVVGSDSNDTDKEGGKSSGSAKRHQRERKEGEEENDTKMIESEANVDISDCHLTSKILSTIKDKSGLQSLVLPRFQEGESKEFGDEKVSDGSNLSHIIAADPLFANINKLGKLRDLGIVRCEDAST